MNQEFWFLTVVLLEGVVSNKLSDDLFSKQSMLSMSNAYSRCKPENDSKWSKKVVIDSRRGKTPPRETVGTPVIPSKRHIKSHHGLDPFSRIKNAPTELAHLIDAKISKMTERACKVIPEPIRIPDININVLKLQADRGVISGIKKLCRNFPLISKFTRSHGRFGFKHELDLSGLHFQYHVQDELLHVNRTFNWTLGEGSKSGMNVLFGSFSRCPVSVDDVDFRLLFAGHDGAKTCNGECRTVLQKLKCFLYYFLQDTLSFALDHLKRSISKVVCVSFKGTG